MSDAATFVPSPARPASAGAGARQVGRLRRWLKVAAALALLAAANWAIFSAFTHVVSDNAVVTAYTVSLRTPISGYVSALHAAVGNHLPAGAVVARIDDPRVDDQRLVDLRNLLDRDRNDRAAYEHERDQLTAQRNMLLQRAAERDRLEALFLKLEAAEAERQARLRETARDYAHRERDRTEELGRLGVAAKSTVDKVRATADQADREAEAAQVRLAYLRVQAEAAQRGMLLESGSNDVPYSSQRADEIAVQLATIEREIESLSAAETETAARLEAEQRRVDLQRHADLRAPADGMLWKLAASAGEHLGAGEEVAELVDCRAAFVLAAIAQDRLPDVQIGGTAHIRLSGEGSDRLARVIAVTGDAGLSEDRALAAAPKPQHSASALARIQLMPDETPHNECLVGRTARVLLPTTPDSGFLSMVLRRFF